MSFAGIIMLSPSQNQPLNQSSLSRRSYWGEGEGLGRLATNLATVAASCPMQEIVPGITAALVRFDNGEYGDDPCRDGMVGIFAGTPAQVSGLSRVKCIEDEVFIRKTINGYVGSAGTSFYCAP